MKKFLTGKNSLIVIVFVITFFLIFRVVREHPSGSMNPDWDWTGKGDLRIMVRVDPRDINGRNFDQGPAKIDLNCNKIPDSLRKGNYIDPNSVEVIAYDKKGKPVEQNTLRNHIFNIAYRWDDVDHRSSNFYYHHRGNSCEGTLIWNHTQRGNQASYYAIYFNTIKHRNDGELGPIYLVGDGDAIYGSDEPLYAGLQLKIEIVDWDNDGLPDFLLGDSPGHLQWYRNTGTKTQPKFKEATFLEVDGRVFEQKYCPAFCAVDWDDDGDLDLIYGKEPLGKVFYLENTGTRSEPCLTSRGQLKCDGKPLRTPGKPFPNQPDPSDAWGGREYMCTPAIVDWDGDGDKDLMLGSYTGGQVYFCENIRNGDGAPELTWRGFLKDADGHIIDSDFAASPEFADLDGDGDQDLMLGGADWTEHAGSQSKNISTNLFYYENIGTSTSPKLKRRPFPDKLRGKGIESVAVPSLADHDNDGDLDLMVSTVVDVSVYKNTGTIYKPWFQPEGLLKTGWNPVMFGGFSSTPFDIDDDGDMDIIASYSGRFKIMKNMDNRYPPKYEDIGFLKFGNKEFKYVFPAGDPELFSTAADLDRDGLTDFLWGNGEGNVWFAKNLGIQAGMVKFSSPRLLMLENGEPLHVGHFDPNASVSDFKTHSGDRSDPGVADFDGDSDMDIMVADNYGGLTYFENVGSNRNCVFAKGKVVKEEDNKRLMLEVTDWNTDGNPDLLFCRSNEVVLWQNTGKAGTPSFAIKENLLKGTSIPYAHPYATDWNGDGDTDLMVANSYMLLYYFERSFLDNGIASGIILKVEKRPD